MTLLEKGTTTEATKSEDADSREHAPTQGVALRLHRFTVEDFFRLGELGILKSDEHFELIDGEIYTKVSPIGMNHSIVEHRLRRAFEKLYSDEGWVAPPVSIILDARNVIEPDVVLLLGKDVDYIDKQPTAESIGLAAEVSNTTIAYDRGDKLKRYAGANVPIYLVVDVQRACVEMYTQPDPADANGPTYGNKQTFAVGQSIVLPAGEIPVAELFPWIK